ncbi:MAG TPA: hypothetical protein VF384_15040 [Planctomycetota bacterium]
MRFENDTAFHLRMAALLIASLFLEQLATKHLPNWSSPQIGVVTFVLGLLWVALFAFHHARTMQNRMRVIEDKLERLNAVTDALEGDRRTRRSLPPM